MFFNRHVASFVSRSFWAVSLLFIFSSTAFAGTVDDFIRNYPEQARILVDQINWKGEGSIITADDDQASILKGILDHYKQSPLLLNYRKGPFPNTKTRADSLLAFLRNAPLKDDGKIDFNNHPRGMTTDNMIRFGFMIELTRAWVSGGKDEYHDTIERVLHDLVTGEPPVFKGHRDTPHASNIWRGLDASIRLRSLLDVLSIYVQGSEMQDDTALLLLSMVWQHADAEIGRAHV